MAVKHPSCWLHDVEVTTTINDYSHIDTLLAATCVTWRCNYQRSAHDDIARGVRFSFGALKIKIMVNEKIIQKFISDLGTITCSDVDAINYFRSFGADPKEYLKALSSMPNVHCVNEKIWVDTSDWK